jgi:tRNA dimethylallyltransferase
MGGGGATRGRLVAVVGATCSGKTGLAIALAEALQGELVNADSRQAIAEVSVGVCKPTPLELRGVSCHGLDWRHLGEPFTVADFVTRARTCLADLWHRRRLPILVGGTGLYVRALLEGFDFGGVGPASEVGFTSSGYGETASSMEVAALLALDPGMASRVDLRNPRRVTRALEMARAGAEPSRAGPGWDAVRIGCRVDPEILKARIRARSELIVGPALQAELEALLALGYTPSTIAGAAIGYAEALAWSQAQCTKEVAVERLVARTWKYARTQLTWLRTEPGLVWIDASEDTKGMVAACRAALDSSWQQEHS